MRAISGVICTKTWTFAAGACQYANMPESFSWFLWTDCPSGLQLLLPASLTVLKSCQEIRVVTQRFPPVFPLFCRVALA